MHFVLVIYLVLFIPLLVAAIAPGSPRERPYDEARRSRREGPWL